MSNTVGNEAPFQWLYLTKTDFSYEAFSISFPNTVTVLLSGENVVDQESLMERISETMRFPAYFGRNWNALEDCLRDLQWLPAENYRIVWQEANHLLSASPEDFTTFLEICLEVSKWWWKHNVSFQLWIRDDFILKMAEIYRDAVILT